jgi:small subunit ribosomal protein S5
VGLACADKVKQVLKLCGIKDVWSKTFGDTRTSENLVKATFNALKNAHKYSYNL